MNRRRKILMAVGIVLVGAIVVPVVHHYQLRAATEAYIAELKAQGEPLDLAQVIPPPVPPEKNGTSNFLRAASLLHTNRSVWEDNPPPAMRMVAPGKAMICRTLPDIRTPGGTNSWPELETALAEDSEALELLCQITNYAAFDFNLNYGKGVERRLAPTTPLIKSAQTLSAKAIDELHRGDMASATEHVSALLALVNAMSQDREVISELVRMAIAPIALADSWEFLQSPDLTDQQLARLQHDWTNLDFIRSEENALAMERVTDEITIAQWRNTYSSLHNYFDDVSEFVGPEAERTVLDTFNVRTKVFRWRYWWSYPDEIRMLNGYQVMLEAARSARTNYSFLAAQQKQESELQSVIGTNDEQESRPWNPAEMDIRFMFSSFVRSSSGLLNKVMRTEAARQLATTAIALKRYQLKHGNYPADLNSLVPEFIPTVPLDPVDGKPLRYRLNSDGTFLLYSIGEDGKDDGGNPSPADPNRKSLSWQFGRDWVWPQPATPEEIQAYYKKIAERSN